MKGWAKWELDLLRVRFVIGIEGGSSPEDIARDVARATGRATTEVLQTWEDMGNPGGKAKEEEPKMDDKKSASRFINLWTPEEDKAIREGIARGRHEGIPDASVARYLKDNKLPNRSYYGIVSRISYLRKRDELKIVATRSSLPTPEPTPAPEPETAPVAVSSTVTPRRWTPEDDAILKRTFIEGRSRGIPDAIVAEGLATMFGRTTASVLKRMDNLKVLDKGFVLPPSKLSARKPFVATVSIPESAPMVEVVPGPVSVSAGDLAREGIAVINSFQSMLAKLEAENLQLREQVSVLSTRCAELEAENADHRSMMDNIITYKSKYPNLKVDRTNSVLTPTEVSAAREDR